MQKGHQIGLELCKLYQTRGLSSFLLLLTIATPSWGMDFAHSGASHFRVPRYYQLRKQLGLQVTTSRNVLDFFLCQMDIHVSASQGHFMR